MKHINEYLNNKIKDDSYINIEFPDSTDFDDIIDWFNRNYFVDISEATKTKNFDVYQQFENVEINKKRFKIKNDFVWFCNSGKISENNPLFNFEIDDSNGNIDCFRMTKTGIFYIDQTMDFEDFKTEVDKYIN